MKLIRQLLEVLDSNKTKSTKTSDYDWKKYNFDKVFNALPKQVVGLIQDLHEEISEYYPAYKKQNAQLEDWVAPVFCEIYFDIKNNKVKDEEDIILLSSAIVDKINLNFNDDEDEKDRYEDDDEHDDKDAKDYYDDDESGERVNQLNSCVEKYLRKFAKMWTEGKFK